MNTSRRDYTFASAITLAFIIGLYVRLLPVLLADFPLNDGGLFYRMAEEIRAAHYRLPLYTAYNAAHIPFTYPPLGFYVAAALADITGASVITVLRFLPAVVSALTIPAFYFFSRDFLGSRLQAVWASFAWALLPRTYAWLIMGGGLTRAPGYLFTILALHQAYLLLTRNELRFVFTTTLCAALTVLSHAEMTWFLIYSLLVMWLFYGRSVISLRNYCLVIAGTAMLTAPWWWTVLSRHSLAPFRAAAQTGHQRWFTLLPTHITGEPFFPILGLLGLSGLIYCLFKRQYFLPLWAILVFVVQPRSARTLTLVPLSMGVGLALDQLILPALNRLGQTVSQRLHHGVESSVLVPTTRFSSQLQAIALGSLWIFALLGAWFLDMGAPQLKALRAEDRTTMQWVSDHTPSNSRFLLLTSTPFWDDSTSEWFPALTQRVSITTVQGSEWLPNQRFYQLWQEANALLSCAKPDVPDQLACVNSWAAKAKAHFSHVYVRKEPKGTSSKSSWQPMVQALRASPTYSMIHDDAGAIIFARKTASDEVHREVNDEVHKARR